MVRYSRRSLRDGAGRSTPGHLWFRTFPVVVAALVTGILAFPGDGVGAAVRAAGAPTARTAPTTPVAPTTPTRICGQPILAGPTTQPPGSVLVPAGSNYAMLASAAVGQLPSATTYYLAAGVHTLGGAAADEIQPGDSDVFIGAPGAILDGQSLDQYAFWATSAQQTSNVTIEYLMIQHFAPPWQTAAVGVDSWSGWTITHDTVQDNYPGTGVMLGSNSTLTESCLTHNGQYGFQGQSSANVSALTGGPSNLTVTNDEISFNNQCNGEQRQPFPITPPPRCSYPVPGSGPNCGCDGGAKFWRVDGAIVLGDYVHDNYSKGLWIDTAGNGFVIEGNYFSRNWDMALVYETSYNALIEGNTFASNAWGAGPLNPPFPTPALYISNSGGDGRVPTTALITSLTVSGNVFKNNWAGIVLWQDPNRFCGSPGNTSVCTLVEPATYSPATCTQANLQGSSPAGSPDYYDNCQWKTQNVSVTGNTFTWSESAVPGCLGATNSCGVNAVVSNLVRPAVRPAGDQGRWQARPSTLAG